MKSIKPHFKTAAFLALLACALTIPHSAVADSNNERDVPASPDVSIEQQTSAGFAKEWRRLMAHDDYQKALELTDQWLEQVIDKHGKQSPYAYEPLWKRAQAAWEVLPAIQARQAYEAVIKHVKNVSGPFDQRLVEPLTDLGRLLMADRLYEEAADALLQAQRITQRNGGIFNLEQEQPLAYLSAVYIALGKGMQAQRMQKLKLLANEEEYGDTPGLVPALQEWAQWNASQDRFYEVNKAFERAIKILEDHYGPESLELVETLRMKAALYRLNPGVIHSVTARDSLKRVASIYAAQEGVDQVDLLQAYSDIGTWSMRQIKVTTAIREYRRGVKKALENGVDIELVNALYGRPLLVFVDRAEEVFFASTVSGERFSGGVVVIRYDVRKNGRPARLRIVHDSVNIPAVTAMAKAIIETQLFRPRFESGKPVRTNDLEQAIEIRKNRDGLEIGRITIPVGVGEAPTDFSDSEVPIIRD